MMTHVEVAATMIAEGNQRFAQAVAYYEYWRRTLETKTAAGTATYQDVDEFVQAERLVKVFVDERQYREITDRIMAEIKAEQGAQR